MMPKSGVPGTMLVLVARALALHGLDAILIGSAALYVRGVDVAPRDLDFLFQDNTAQRRRLAAVAATLGCFVARPYYRRSLRWRLERAKTALVADFVCALDGFRSVEGLRSRASMVDVGGASLCVATVADVLRSKRATARAKDCESAGSRAPAGARSHRSGRRLRS